MAVDYECLNSTDDHIDLMNCLDSIKEDFENTDYIDVDDLCNFLKRLRPTLYDIINQITKKETPVGIDTILEKVFAILLHIHKRTQHKEDLLDEFNLIHEILSEYDSGMGIKQKLDTLKGIYDKCEVYYNRPVGEIMETETTQVDEEITPEDYSFLQE